MAVITTESGHRVIGDSSPQPRPDVRLTDPDYDLSAGKWKTDEPTEAEQKRRREYVSEFFKLPGANATKLDPWAWRTNILSRLWPDTADAPSVELPELRTTYADACWAWCGAHQSDGRCVIRISGAVRSLPRVLWTLFRGGAPDARRQVVRTCWERGADECCNPFHAKLMTRAEATAYRHARQRASEESSQVE